MNLSDFMRAYAAEHDDDHTALHEPSAWLRYRLEELHAPGLCEHLTVDMVGLSALRRPAWVACLDCMHEEFARHSDDERCDRCGVVAPITPLISDALPQIVLLFELCAGCYHREVGG